jgi:ligand-binding sensor domain-containing protein
LLLVILEDSKYNLWIADYGFGRLHQFNRKTGQFKHYLTNNNMTGIYQDHDGKLWAGSGQGLYEYDGTTDSFHIFVDPATGSTIATLAITEDNSKNLWLTTRRNGFYRIDSTAMRSANSVRVSA